jgi:hypothetical protein
MGEGAGTMYHTTVATACCAVMRQSDTHGGYVCREIADPDLLYDNC